MIKSKYILSLIFLLLSLAAFSHPIKMSTGKVEINSSTASLKVTLNFFMDDFESALRKIYPQAPFNYNEPAETMLATINDYVKKNLEIKIHQTALKMNYESLQVIENNVCQIIYSGSFEKKDTSKLISIKNILLFDSFSKQSNILHLVVDDKAAKILQFFPGVPVRQETF